jgi:hypothetical protein
MGESELDPSGDCIDHNGVCCPEVADPIYMPSSGSDSDDGWEVFMVRQGEPPNLIAEEIAREAEEEIARAARLAWQGHNANGKRHQQWQDDSGAFDGEAENGVNSGVHHPKFNWHWPTGGE